MLMEYIRKDPRFKVADHYGLEVQMQQLIEEMAERQGVTEKLKAEQPMEWIGKMNNIQACAREVVNSEVIFV